MAHPFRSNVTNSASGPPDRTPWIVIAVTLSGLVVLWRQMLGR